MNVEDLHSFNPIVCVDSLHIFDIAKIILKECGKTFNLDEYRISSFDGKTVDLIKNDEKRFTFLSINSIPICFIDGGLKGLIYKSDHVD